MALLDDNLSWLWLVPGCAVGVAGAVGGIYYWGRRAAKRMRLEDRGACDHPLPHPFPPEHVVAVYKRRRDYHKHNRHHYRRKRARKRQGG